MLPSLIFVHGACVRDADWWWEPMRKPLAARGIRTVAVALPSCGEAGDGLGDLHDDAAACRDAIAAVDGPVALLGHSYGGMVITEAGADDRVERLIYLTSVMPDAGESQAELTAADPAPWLDPGDDGTIGVHPDPICEYFLQDCDEETKQEALSRLTRQSAAPFTQSPERIAWRERPTTYIVCTEDLATPAEVQHRRGSARRHPGRRVRGGHHPFLSRPDAFASVLAAELGAVS